MGDTDRETISHEVSDLKKEKKHLKQLVAGIALKNRILISRRPSTHYSGTYPIKKSFVTQLNQKRIPAVWIILLNR